MYKKRQISIRTALLITPFLYFITSNAQTKFTKSLFYNLPIDKPKSEIVESLKSDTNLFRPVPSRHNGDNLQVIVKENSKYFPKTTSSPIIDVYNTKYYVDSIYKYSTSTICLVLEYESTFGFKRKARKTFLLLTKQLEKDYVSFINTNSQFENEGKIISKGKTRKFYNNSNREPICIIEYYKHNNIKVWNVSITYHLK